VHDLRFCGVAEDSRRYVAGELNLPLGFPLFIMCDKSICIVVNCAVMLNKGILDNVIAM